MGCRSGLYDQLADPVVTMKNSEKYYLTEDDIEKLLRSNTHAPNLYHQYMESKIEELDDLHNPGVPMAIVYGSHSRVRSSFEYS